MVDVSSKASIERAFADVLKAFKTVHVLVNSAGVIGKVTLQNMTEEEWDRVLDINLKGTALCTQAAIAPMRAQGGGAVPGTTYLGSQGNPFNYSSVCFAENEERSPWEPFHVQKGFKPGDSVVSIFRGRTFSHLLEVREKTWREQFLNLVSGFTPTPRTSLTLLLEPLAARTLKQREGFHSKAKLAQWFHENARIPAEVYWDYQLVINYIERQARKGVEPFASYLKLPKDAMVPRFAEPEKISTLVVGGEKNAYWFATDFGWPKSESVDRWR